jgi:hypothetical protein
MESVPCVGPSLFLQVVQVIGLTFTACFTAFLAHRRIRKDKRDDARWTQSQLDQQRAYCMSLAQEERDSKRDGPT